MANISASGYVHRMLDENMDFRQFVWNCARAMGALYMLRDNSDSKIDIDELCKPSDYYLKSLEEAKNEFETLSNMKSDERKKYGQEARDKEIEYYNSLIGINNKEYNKIEEMLNKIKDWKTPSSEHNDFKNFMLGQLRISLDGNNDDYYRECISKARKRTPYERWADNLNHAKERIKYYEKEYQQELDRCAKRKIWLQLLVDSVGEPV